MENRNKLLTLLMIRKFQDNILLEKESRMRRDQARRKMSATQGQNSTPCRKVVRKAKDEGMRVRMK